MASLASRARIKCAWWMGSKVPPKIPIFFKGESYSAVSIADVGCHFCTVFLFPAFDMDLSFKL